MKKIVVLLLMLFSISFVIAGCSSSPSEEPQTPEETPSEGEEEELMLTLEELSAFDGKNGNKAYVAVDGIIYDVTDSSAWKDGNHNGNQAGQDLTKEIMEDSPHGISALENVPAIGKLVED